MEIIILLAISLAFGIISSYEETERVPEKEWEPVPTLPKFEEIVEEDMGYIVIPESTMKIEKILEEYDDGTVFAAFDNGAAMIVHKDQILKES